MVHRSGNWRKHICSTEFRRRISAEDCFFRCFSAELYFQIASWGKAFFLYFPSWELSKSDRAIVLKLFRSDWWRRILSASENSGQSVEMSIYPRPGFNDIQSCHPRRHVKTFYGINDSLTSTFHAIQPYNSFERRIVDTLYVAGVLELGHYCCSQAVYAQHFLAYFSPALEASSL